MVGVITGPLVVVIDDSFEFGFVVLDLLWGEHWFCSSCDQGDFGYVKS